MGTELTFCLARQRLRSQYKDEWLAKVLIVLNNHNQYPVQVTINDPNWGLKNIDMYATYQEISDAINLCVSSMFEDYLFDM